MPRYVCPNQLLYVSLFTLDLFQFLDDVRVGVQVQPDDIRLRVRFLVFSGRFELCFCCLHAYISLRYMLSI